MKKSAIVFGDYTSPSYHPLEGVDQELQGILGSDFYLSFTEDYGDLNTETLQKYELCILYLDFRKDKKIEKHQADALLSYLNKGGGLLSIHNGISIQSNDAVMNMFGGKFTGHPPYDVLPVLDYTITARENPIVSGLEGFTLGDEPYMFDFLPSAEKTFLFEYTYEGKQWPAAWCKEHGTGKVVYLAPGHNAQGFKNSVFRQIILNSGKWAAR